MALKSVERKTYAASGFTKVTKCVNCPDNKLMTRPGRLRQAGDLRAPRKTETFQDKK